VHEVAWSVNPAARVAYVDNDPLVVAHDRALLVDSADITVARGDIRQPREIICDDAVRGLIDFSRPVGVLFVAVLHFVTDEEYAHDSVAVFRNSVPSGSYLVVSHITSDGSDPNVMRAIRDAYADATAPAVFRTAKDIERFFDRFGLLQPGLVDVAEWRSGRKPEAAEIRFVGAVGRKP
jgi:S-adenosyl methyltransferase